MNVTAEKKIGAETTALAELLGRLDATFWPFAGNAERRNVGATMEQRQAWISGRGLPVRSHGTVNARKDAEQFWKRLEQAGMVTVARSRGRRTHAKLTWAGELAMRALCGTTYPAETWDEFLTLAALHDSTGEPSLPESFVCGAEPWTASEEQQARLYRQRCHLLPYTAAGFVTFWHDCRGAQWLHVTEAGREAIQTLTPVWPPDGLDIDDAVCGIYDQAYRDETARLATATAESTTNLYPPASSGIGWGDFARFMELRRDREHERRAYDLD